MQKRHVRYFLRLAEQASSHFFSPEMDTSLERLESEEANLRVALAWCLARQDTFEIGLRLAGTLSWYWFSHGSLHEGRRWLEAMPARSAIRDHNGARGKALVGGGLLAFTVGNKDDASLYEEEGLSILREVGDKHGISNAQTVLGLVRLSQGNIVEARMLSPYHAVELYQDGTMWIIDGEDPPREIKLEPQAVQRLRDFLMKPDEQHYTASYPYQQHMTIALVPTIPTNLAGKPYYPACESLLGGACGSGHKHHANPSYIQSVHVIMTIWDEIARPGGKRSMRFRCCNPCMRSNDQGRNHS